MNKSNTDKQQKKKFGTKQEFSDIFLYNDQSDEEEFRLSVGFCSEKFIENNQTSNQDSFSYYNS